MEQSPGFEPSEASFKNFKYYIKQSLDCVDEMGQWLNAEVVAMRVGFVKVHFSGYSAKYDVWIEQDSVRLQKQWTHGKELKLNNRIDVLDKHKKWYEARVAEIEKNRFRVHFWGFHARHDEWI